MATIQTGITTLPLTKKKKKKEVTAADAQASSDFLNKVSPENFPPQTPDPLAPFRGGNAAGGSLTDKASITGGGTPQPLAAGTGQITQPTVYRDKTGVITGLALPNGKSFFGIDSNEAARIAADYAGKFGTPAGTSEFPQAPNPQVQQNLAPYAPLNQDLQGNILNQPNLAPTQGFVSAVSEKAANPALSGVALIGNSVTAALEAITGNKYGRTSGAELAKTTFGKVLGLGIEGSAAALAGIYAFPYLTQLFTGKVAAASLTAKFTLLGSVLGGLSTYFIGKQALDYKGGELDTMRSIVGSFTEDGERIQALATQGGDIYQLLNTLSVMNDEVNNAESTIQEIGNYNVQFRYEKEWMQDMQKIRSARLAIQRRVVALQNLAQTGQTTVDPTALMQLAAQFDATNG